MSSPLLERGISAWIVAMVRRGRETCGVIQMVKDNTQWVDKNEICGKFGYNGQHLQVDGALLYCGQCKTPIE